MTSKQTFMQRLKSKQQAKALFRSRDDLDIRKSKDTSQVRLKRPSKFQSQRALPALPVSPKRSSPKTHYSSSCENIYEEISEEFIKEVVRRKPQDPKSNQLSDDDYGFAKHDTRRSRNRVSQNIRGMLSYSKAKLFSPKDEEVQKNKRNQTRNNSSTVTDESMAIMPDMLYNLQVASPSKAKQSCLCPHPHPRRPCVPPLRQEFSKPQSVQDTSSRQQSENVSDQHTLESSAESQPSRTTNQWVVDMSRPTVTAAVSVSNPCASSGIPSQLARPQNRTSCTDSITPYFSGGSDSGVSVSSEGSYGNSAQLSPMAPAHTAQILPYPDDSVFLNSAAHMASGSRIPTMEQHQQWIATHSSNPAQKVMQGQGHLSDNSGAMHPLARCHQTVLQPALCQRVNNTLHTQSMAGVPQVAFSRPVKTLPAPQVLRDSFASDCDSKIDYLKPTCTHNVTTNESQNGFPLSPKDEGFSEPGVQESNFVRRAKEKIYQKLRHLDLAESDSNSNIVDPSGSHIYIAHTDTEDEEMYPNVVGYKQRQCSQNGVQPPTTVNQADAPITFADIFTSISLRKGLHQIDTDTLSPVRDINYIPPPLPHRSRKVQCPVRRPLPSIPQSESECSSGAPSPVDTESNLSQPFGRSKSLNNCERVRDKQEEPSDSNGQKTSNLLSPNFHRHGLRKPIHGRRSVSSENSSTEQSDSEFTKSKTVRYSKGHSKGDLNSKTKGGPVKQLIKKKESSENVSKARRHSTGTSPSVCSLDSKNGHGPKTDEHNHNEDSNQNEHNQTSDSLPGFQPVQSKFNTDRANSDTSPKRLAVRATGSYRREEYQKQSGSSSALSDLLRRNHDRQLLVFV